MKADNIGSFNAVSSAQLYSNPKVVHQHKNPGEEVRMPEDGFTPSIHDDSAVKHSNITGEQTKAASVDTNTATTAQVATKAKDSSPEVITIIHTNDMHGALDPKGGDAGVARVSSTIHQIENQNPNHILLDAGDIAYAPPYSDRNRFNPMPEIMNKIGYDVLSAGNHEFQYEAKQYGGIDGNPNPDLIDNMKELKSALNFPLICANATIAATGQRPDFLQPYIIKKVGDVNVGVVGVVTQRLATQAHPQVGDGWKIQEQSEVLKKVIPEMKAKGADMIVVLSHDNLGRNKDIISKTPGIDIMIGSHDHQITDPMLEVKDPTGKNVPLVEAGAYAKLVGELKVDVDPSSKKVLNVTSTLHPVGQAKADPEIASIVNKWKDR